MRSPWRGDIASGSCKAPWSWKLEARDKLLRYYFEQVECGLDAAWRGSMVDRVQPGSLVGSQAQESYHQHRLRPGLGTIRLSMDLFMQNLTVFMETRAEQATQFPPFLV